MSNYCIAHQNYPNDSGKMKQERMFCCQLWREVQVGLRKSLLIARGDVTFSFTSTQLSTFFINRYLILHPELFFP